MSSQEPAKADIDAILKRLRSISANKSCFDCGSKNPTWSSVTYGVFICIDCSATHRSLGVHLSFVRSTQLDTNWTWIQLRSMQLGGNANATSFFEQHNCTTKDAQQKYNSRAAQLYRDKLHQSAIKAQRTYGNKVHLDEGPKEILAESKDSDFFNEHTVIESKFNNNQQIDHSSTSDIVDKSHEGPNVAAALYVASEETDNVQIKSNILQKKPLQAKKKGLGAQKVSTDFKEIERNLHEQEKQREYEQQQEAKTREETEKSLEKQMASMKLAYDNLDKQREKEETKLKQSDPKKAQQLERLGMAAGNRGSGISHSALSDMTIIQQEGVYTNNKTSLASITNKSNRDFFDDFESNFSSNKSSNSKSKYSNNNDDDDFKGFSGFGTKNESISDNKTKNKDDWVILDDKYEDSQPPSILSMDNNYSNGRNNGSSNNSNKSSTAISNSNNGEAMKRFANAKAISSEQFFGNKNESEQRNASSRFENSTSISSDDYFGDGKKKQPSQSMTPDMSVLKQDLKEGVTKMAGKLSNMASNVMSSLQRKS